jgi:hypothetical protein
MKYMLLIYSEEQPGPTPNGSTVSRSRSSSHTSSSKTDSTWPLVDFNLFRSRPAFVSATGNVSQPPLRARRRGNSSTVIPWSTAKTSVRGLRLLDGFPMRATPRREIRPLVQITGCWEGVNQHARHPYFISIVQDSARRPRRNQCC